MLDVREQLVTQPAELKAFCDYLASCKRFGLDTEFVGEDTYHPHLCLVQVATTDRLILIDPMTAGPLDAFWNLVVDPEIQVVVHAGREEVRLCRLWAGEAPSNLFDLQIAAGMVGMTYPLGHGTLVNQLLNVQMDKSETLTEWRDRPLSRAQLSYAYDDVRYLLPLWEKLARQLDDLGRADWCQEEFGRLAANASPEDLPVEKWRKLRGLGSLDRHRLAIVRDLFAWREEAAARLNRPARTVCRDDLLVEIARRNPRRERDLQIVRGLPRRDLGTILDVVEKTRELPLEACPERADREQDPPQINLLANVLTAVLNDRCVRHRLAPNLVANSHEIKQLIRAKIQDEPLPADLLLAQGWRGQHILPELLAVLDGRWGLRVNDVGSLTPFSYPGEEPKQG